MSLLHDGIGVDLEWRTHFIVDIWYVITKYSTNEEIANIGLIHEKYNGLQ